MKYRHYHKYGEPLREEILDKHDAFKLNFHPPTKKEVVKFEKGLKDRGMIWSNGHYIQK